MKITQAMVAARAALEGGKAELAGEILRSCLQHHPDAGELWYLLGVAAHLQGRLEEACHSLRRAVTLLPDDPAPLAALGTVLGQCGRHEQARDQFLRALELTPGDPSLLTNLGIACEALGRRQEALASYDRALAADPDWRDARLNRARLHLARGDTDAAREDYDHLLQRDPADAEARFSRAETGLVDGQFEAVIEDCRLLLQQEPSHGGALLDLGVAMAALGRLEGAQAIFERLRSEPPPALAGWRLPGEEAPPALESLDARAIYLLQAWKRLQRADWRDREKLILMVEQAAEQAPTPALCEPAVAFPLLSLPLEPRTLRIWIRRIARRLEDSAGEGDPCVSVPDPARGRIRIGYLSGHFGNHPNYLNMGRVYDGHDRDRFEVIGLSLGPDDGSCWYHDIATRCDRFLDLHGLDLDGCRKRIRELGVDILIDLDGFTSGARPVLVAQRLAPVQISYLGFAAPMPARFYDYDITSRMAEPLPWQGEPTSPIFLPHVHWLFDERDLPAELLERTAQGLPEDAVVYCCFNNTYKIDPGVFSVWMELLRSVPGSVLWLLVRRQETMENLYRAAAAEGVDPARLVFAPFVDITAHQARYPLADLFLDTFCYNAHTTAQEALWSGLPVLTCPGRTRASRICGALVRASGLPELVCDTPRQYLQRAVTLGRDPSACRNLKERLARNRDEAPLFRVAERIRDLERACELAWQRHLAGQPPAPIDLEPSSWPSAGR